MAHRGCVAAHSGRASNSVRCRGGWAEPAACRDWEDRQRMARLTGAVYADYGASHAGVQPAAPESIERQVGRAAMELLMLAALGLALLLCSLRSVQA